MTDLTLKRKKDVREEQLLFIQRLLGIKKTRWFKLEDKKTKNGQNPNRVTMDLNKFFEGIKAPVQ